MRGREPDQRYPCLLLIVLNAFSSRSSLQCRVQTDTRPWKDADQQARRVINTRAALCFTAWEHQATAQHGRGLAVASAPPTEPHLLRCDAASCPAGSLPLRPRERLQVENLNEFRER